MKLPLAISIGTGIALAVTALMSQPQPVDNNDAYPAPIISTAVNVGYPAPVDGYPVPPVSYPTATATPEYAIDVPVSATPEPTPTIGCPPDIRCDADTCEYGYCQTPTSAPVWEVTP